jgi:methionyl-tRNA formyltransferase
MRLIMLGTGPFAVPTLASLLDSPHEVVALVTRPSITGQTRGKSKTPPNPMRELAESRGLRVLAPDNINDPTSREQLSDFQTELLVVCDYGQILSPETLSTTPLGGINLHGSLLPKYRGAAPVQWAIWRGERVTGVTIIHMTPRLDAGPILVQRTAPIGETETAADLEPRLARIGVQPVHEALELLAVWDRVSPLGVSQDPAQASRAPRLKKNDGDVDWSRTAEQIFCQFRAVQPWPGMFSHYVRTGREPVRLILEEVTPAPADATLEPGVVSSSESDELRVGTGQGTLAIRRLQPAGRRSMQVQEFLRGNPIQPGDRFVSIATLQEIGRIPYDL